MWSAVGINSLQLKPISIAVISLLGNAIDAAVSILSRYGGSLWVSDPAYVFTGSDGTGTASDGSDTGYVRDLCASYGAELVTNGDFSAGTAGWAVTGTSAVLSVASGVATVTNGGSAEASLTLPNTVAGKVYEVTADIVALSGTPTVYFVPPAGSSTGNIPKTGAGQLRGVFVSGGGGCRIAVGVSTAGAFFSIDNISVREIIGRPLFQATTGFKPKLKRVPKKLGPELCPSTASLTGWASHGDAALSSDGTALKVTNHAAWEGMARFNARLKSGTSYVLNVEVTAMVNNGGSFFFGSHRWGLGGLGVKSILFVPSADTTTANFGTDSGALGDSVTLKGASVREVLEWGWAWVFDGTDDLLATVSQPAITGETFIAASKIATASVAAAQALMSKRTDINGSFLRRETTGATAASVVQADGVFRPAPLSSPDVDLSRHVYTQKITASLNVARLDGVQSGQIGCAPNPVATSIQIGAVLAARLNGEIYAAAYAPAAIPDAELLIVERAMAQLAGVTI